MKRVCFDLFVICIVLFTAFPYYANAGTALPPPDISKDNLNLDETRDAYLENENIQLKESLAELDKRGIVIIPTPKNITFNDADIKVPLASLPEKVKIVTNRSGSIPGEYLENFLKSIGALRELSKTTPSEISSEKEEIYIVLCSRNGNLTKYLPASLPGTPQGYTISTINNGKARIYALAGHDKEGLLYAAVTLCKLITRDNDNVVFPDVNVSDWPDVLYRCASSLEWEFRKRFWENSTNDAESGKKYIDWALEHKINMIWGISGDDPYSCTGSPAYKTAEMRKWLKAVNSYAKERNIYVMLPQTFAIGISIYDIDKPDYKGCLNYKEGLFCWSRDKLIDKKIAALNQFLKDSDYSGIVFRSIDARNCLWEDRCDSCKKRFGDDRTKADANVINRLYHGIKDVYPDKIIAFTCRPDRGNPSAPAPLMKKGKLKNSDDMQRFSQIIPAGAYLTRRECNRQEYLGWKKAMRQPVLLYQEGKETEVPLNGRYFSSAFRYPLTYFTPFSHDIFFYNGGGRPEDLSSIGAAEYSWNLKAPGSAVYDAAESYTENKTRSKVALDLWDTFGEDKSKNSELQDFIKRACRDLYGTEDAPFFYNVFIAFIDWNFVFETKTVIAMLKEANFKCADRETAAWMRRIYEATETATKELEILLYKNKSTPYTTEAIVYYLARLNQIKTGAHALHLAALSELAAKEKKYDEAKKLLDEAFTSYSDDFENLRNLWPSLASKVSFHALPHVNLLANNFNIIKNMLEITRVKLESRIEIYSHGKNAKHENITGPEKINTTIKVALFNPNKNKGSAYGVDGLLKTLKQNQDMDVTVITDLGLENLKKYDCLVFPDCRSFGRIRISITDLRKYVIEHGGGIYFEHNSCGFMRFPVQASMFPEIAEVDIPVGVHPRDVKYKEEDREFFMSQPHPITAGNVRGLKFKQIYYSHLQLKKGDEGIIPVRNYYKRPVVICGEKGKGKVMFSGLLTYDTHDVELEKPLDTPEGENIVNGIKWLSGKEGTSINIMEIVKKEEVAPEGVFSKISLSLEIIPCKPMENAILYAKCYDPDTLRALSDEIQLCDIGNISKKWSPGEKFTLRIPENPNIKLSLILRSKNGTVIKNTLLDAP
ncbi:MAG: hypothetical protein A2017_21475 [Lentisphaerae bacterium GWF2_44_16]|nr:MAG: hypothetical protein A2017_21475 [Lentisphaerae bacterium GWF2_44_16]